jgi:hypothetical protein
LDTAAIEAIRFQFSGDVLWAAVVQGRAAVPDVAALDTVQQVDPGLPDEVNRRQVAVLQAMARGLDDARWVPLKEALMLLSYEHDRRLLEGWHPAG